MKPKGSFFKSLRFRILIMLVLLGAIPSVLALHVAISSYENRAIGIRRDNIREQCTTFVAMMLREGYKEDPWQSMITSNLELQANLYRGRIILVDRNFRVIRDTYGIDEGKYLLSELVIRCFRGENADRYDREDQMIEVAVPICSPEEPDLLGVMLVCVSSGEVSDTIQALQQREILMSVLIIGAVILLAFFLSVYLVRPFALVTKSIEDLTDGYQDGDISVDDYTETALITGAFNRMLSRMKTLDDSRNEFVSNVSHELKTPMTSMKVLADSLVGQEGVPEELYQEFLQDITKEIDRENKIISDLLSLVRLDKKVADLNIRRTNINEVIVGILRRLRPIADKRSIDLILDSYRTVEADIDELKFTSAISNLVENGIKYNVDDGWVRVTINADHQYFFITVADSGMGIPAASIDRIFERFYRVDKSHSKEIGGTGLGLAITRSAIAAHHGTIHVDSTEGEGTTFQVRIPLIYSA